MRLRLVKAPNMDKPLFTQFRRDDISIFTRDGHIRPLEEIERDVIRLALAKSGGSITRAAAQLRIGRSTFYRKL